MRKTGSVPERRGVTCICHRSMNPGDKGLAAVTTHKNVLGPPASQEKGLWGGKTLVYVAPRGLLLLTGFMKS